jgi:hypothetical protein
MESASHVASSDHSIQNPTEALEERAREGITSKKDTSVENDAILG